MVKRVTRKNKNLESVLPLTISAQKGLVDQNDFFNKTVASRDVSGYYLVKKGEFAYNKSYSNGYPWGAIKRLNHYAMGVLSTLYIVFEPIDIDTDFLEKYYDTTYWHKEVSKHAAEGARNHGLLNIAASDFFETDLVAPQNIDEQQKIGTFFKQLDDLITLHHKKLEQLKSKQTNQQRQKLLNDERRFEEIDQIIQRLYEDNITGKLSDERFMKMSQNYEQEQSKLKDVISTAKQELSAQENQSMDISRFMQRIHKYTKMTELSVEIANELINKIIIYKPEGNKRNRILKIEIHYNFIGNLDT